MKEKRLHLQELTKAFSSQRFFRKTELREFFRSRLPDLTGNEFRRVLYALEKRGLIRKVDRGVYVWGKDRQNTRPTEKYIPAFSDGVKTLCSLIKENFPFLDFLIWETRILHEFMLHLPGQNQIILETERETEESVFNFLSDRRMGEVFLQPDRQMVERYILPLPESVIVSTMITQSPLRVVEGIPSPKIEKILVDVFAGDDKFFVLQGQELVHIFNAVFERFMISEKTLFRYAERRKIGQRLSTFINQETDIQLIQFGAVSG